MVVRRCPGQEKSFVVPGIKLQPLPWRRPVLQSQDKEGWMTLTGRVVTLQRNMPVASLCCPGSWRHLEDFPALSSFSAVKFPLLEGKGCDLVIYHNEERKCSLAS